MRGTSITHQVFATAAPMREAKLAFDPVISDKKKAHTTESPQSVVSFDLPDMNTLFLPATAVVGSSKIAHAHPHAELIDTILAVDRFLSKPHMPLKAKPIEDQTGRSSRHEKLKRKSLTLKQWAKVREAKQCARESHAELVQAMGLMGQLHGEGQENDARNAEGEPQLRKPRRDRQELRANMRRNARLASRDSRCFPKEWEM